MEGFFCGSALATDIRAPAFRRRLLDRRGKAAGRGRTTLTGSQAEPYGRSRCALMAHR
jgi:hypothetical protein